MVNWGKTQEILKLILIVCLCFVLLLNVAGCTPSPCVYSGFTMDSPFTVKIYADASVSDEVYERLKEAADTSHLLLSAFEKDSALYKINNRQPVSQKDEQEIIKILNECKKVSVLSNERYSVVCGAITRLWGIGTDNEKVPTKAEALAKSALCKSDKANTENGKISLSEEGVLLDFGSVGKGFLCDKAKEIFEASDIDFAIASFGGSIVTYRQKEGSNWKIDIRSPFDNEICGVLNIESTAFISTSGGYERFLKKDGQTYHHIFDLSTGMPSNSDIASVTVISQNGVLSDALSTACFILGLKDSVSLLEKTDNVSAVFVLNNKEIYTYNAKDLFSATNGFTQKGEV